jgi:hypothetical protein
MSVLLAVWACDLHNKSCLSRELKFYIEQHMAWYFLITYWCLLVQIQYNVSAGRMTFISFLIASSQYVVIVSLSIISASLTDFGKKMPNFCSIRRYLVFIFKMFLSPRLHVQPTK